MMKPVLALLLVGLVGSALAGKLYDGDRMAEQAEILARLARLK